MISSAAGSPSEASRRLASTTPAPTPTPTPTPTTNKCRANKTSKKPSGGGRSKRSERARADTDEAKKGTKEKRRGTVRGNNVKDLWTISAMHAHGEKMHSYHVRRGLIKRQKQISAVTTPQTLSAVRNKHFVTSKKKTNKQHNAQTSRTGLTMRSPGCVSRPTGTGTNVNARVPTRDIERGKRRSRSSRRRRGGGGGCSSNERTKGEEGSGKQRKGEALSSN